MEVRKLSLLLVTSKSRNESWLRVYLCQHLTTRIRERLETKTHNFKHLSTNRNYKELCVNECFESMDSHR